MNALSTTPKSGSLLRSRSPLFNLFDEDMFTPWRQMDSVFERVGRTSSLYETDNNYIVQLAAPGINAENAEISVNGSDLTVRADYVSAVPEGATPVWTGVSSGSIYEHFTLPNAVTGDGAIADYNNGILTITLPKVETAKSIKVSVNK